ncbi:MAG TPA: FecR domain-containing protein, partial [Puia sp.]|nr:FecR domain-containing protein [Puia sp.]
MENLDDQNRKLLQDDQAYTDRPEEVRQLADAIWSDITTRLDTGSTDTAEAPARRRRLAGPVAASVLGLLVLIGAVMWIRQPRPAPLTRDVPKVANLLVRQDLDRVNQTDRSQTVYLVDGTRVVLQPGSGIRHAAFLQKDKREVYLEGNAYFDVAKDAHRAFYVYSGDVVVRVLGTSFNVVTDRESGDITVLVKTGKVAVTRKTIPLPHPLILTTNQIAYYKGQSRDLVQLKAEEKDPEIIPTAPAVSFNFDETPVTEI